jgi:hypothetical protein
VNDYELIFTELSDKNKFDEIIVLLSQANLENGKFIFH